VSLAATCVGAGDGATGAGWLLLFVCALFDVSVTQPPPHKMSVSRMIAPAAREIFFMLAVPLFSSLNLSPWYAFRRIRSSPEPRRFSRPKVIALQRQRAYGVNQRLLLQQLFRQNLSFSKDI
jgi:hypothetical protein